MAFTRLLILTALAAVMAFAQVDTGSITGVVSDSSGAAIPGAAVAIKNQGTGQNIPLTTNESGLYVSGPLRPGIYTVEVTSDGFEPAAKRLTLDVNQRAAVDFSLNIGAITETVTVQDIVPVLQTESATLSSLRTEKSIKDLPLNSRNFTQLIQLGAGAVPTQDQVGGLQVTQKRGIPNVSVNGARHLQNNILIEGMSNMENHNGNGILIYPSVDAIGEFRVESSSVDAQSGRGSGATINLVYKSGTQDFHGGVYEFLRNEKLDAKNFFDAGGDPIPPFKMNQFGAFLGGPVIPGKDQPKTFFFADYEGARVHQSQTFVSTIPDMNVRQGNFSTFSRPIYDPLTQAPQSEGFARQQFANNTIPTSRLDPVGINLLDLYPTPNRVGESNNFLANPLRTNTGNKFDVKIDRVFSSRDTFFGRYSYSDDNLVEPSFLGYPGVGGGPGVPGTAKQPVQQIVLSETHSFSPSIVNEARAGWTRLNLRQLPVTYGHDVTSDIGIPGANVAGDEITSGLALFSISGFTGLGDNGFSPAIVVSDNLQYSDNLSYTRGRHSFKFGGEYQRRRYNALQSNAFRGSMSFSGAYSLDPATGGNSGSGAADVLLGKPKSGLIRYIPGTRGFRRNEISWYAQDTWKTTDRLTLTLGIRYDNYGGGPWVEVADRMYQFVQDLGTVVQVGTNGIPRSGINNDNNNFSPRLGIAYRLGGKTVVRGGAGVYYSPMLLDVTRNLGANPPEFISSQFTNSDFDFVGARPASMGFDRPPQGTITGDLRAIDPTVRTPYTGQWNIAVQHQLSQKNSITVAYVGSKGTKLQGWPDINQPVPGTGNVALRRDYPAFGAIQTVQNRFNSNYHSLQLTADRRVTKGLAFQASYTLSHAIDDLRGQSFADGPMDFRNIARDRGNSDLNVPQRFVASWTYELPFKVEGPFNQVVNGWQINGIGTFASGGSMDTSSPNTTNCCSSRPDRIGQGNLPSDEQTIHRWFDTSAFVRPGAQLFGNSGRNVLYGPGTKQVDLSIFKNFYFSDDQVRRLQFRAEFFNIANTPQFNNPNTNIGSTAVGTISSAGSPISFQRTSRQIQFGLKFYF
ncbi:MAG: hypothetical protein GC160_29160 [Acidobacteria bacterium]|nr:hypothetical protein [Acidobacteriota bacterium]